MRRENEREECSFSTWSIGVCLQTHSLQLLPADGRSAFLPKPHQIERLVNPREFVSPFFAFLPCAETSQPPLAVLAALLVFRVHGDVSPVLGNEEPLKNFVFWNALNARSRTRTYKSLTKVHPCFLDAVFPFLSVRPPRRRSSASSTVSQSPFLLHKQKCLLVSRVFQKASVGFQGGPHGEPPGL